MNRLENENAVRALYKRMHDHAYAHLCNRELREQAWNIYEQGKSAINEAEDGASISDIASETKLKISELYRAFASKNHDPQLLTELIDHVRATRIVSGIKL